jgi:hypothetical protein
MLMRADIGSKPQTAEDAEIKASKNLFGLGGLGTFQLKFSHHRGTEEARKNG